MLYWRQAETVKNMTSLSQPFPEIKRKMEKGISVLKQGGLVAFPTDTVYGLGAAMNIPRAVERIYEVKQRPRGMALPLLLAHTSQISEIAESVPQIAWLLVRHFLPGALTIVLNKSSSVPDIVTAGGKTVAVRIPDHEIPIALIKGVGVPIVGTSANLSGKPSPLTTDEVCSQLGAKVDLVIDGGRCPGGKESTVVDVTGEKPVILRQGAISKEELEKVCHVKFEEAG
jgi:L-threonylcarbamoyladenylate synthase